MTNVIAFPARFGESYRDRIVIFRRLMAEQQVAFAVCHVDQHGKSIAQLWEGRELDIRAVRQ